MIFEHHSTDFSNAQLFVDLNEPLFYCFRDSLSVLSHMGQAVFLSLSLTHSLSVCLLGSLK